jgi:hypothetical protein
MAEQWTTMPTLTAARLVAGHVDLLWGQWVNESEGCCAHCCAPCAALKDLMDCGLLDDLYRAYMNSASAGLIAVWDYDKDEINRRWLLDAWRSGSADCNHEA